MVYVALLRGINVGGKNKMEMARLKATFEAAGMKDVTTYINSGNVVFSDNRRKAATITTTLEKAIEADFGLAIKVLVRDLPTIKKILKALPASWTNDSKMRCDVFFLWESFDKKDVLDQLNWKPEIEDLVYVPGAVIWRIDRTDVNRSRLQKMVGTDLYRGMTIRNCTTVRRLGELMETAS
ncbi:MAG TPA: DUF1697 domain-containing protein [Acidimicrobiia bacterium]|nr:DUF1697 domain-containing protein [Acidimicrobiia bacterium]